MTVAIGTLRTFVISVNQKILLGTPSMPFYEGTIRHRRSSFRPQGEVTMLDESQRLRETPHLLSLLSHYAQMGSEDRATWRDRLMQMEGVEPKQLSALHGELIAFDWIEQNTGQALSVCYWITPNGLREHRRFQGVEIVESEAPEKPARFARKKKGEVLVVVTSEESLVPAA
jgi:hypothetical protein